MRWAPAPMPFPSFYCTERFFFEDSRIFFSLFKLLETSNVFDTTVVLFLFAFCHFHGFFTKQFSHEGLLFSWHEMLIFLFGKKPRVCIFLGRLRRLFWCNPPLSGKINVLQKYKWIIKQSSFQDCYQIGIGLDVVALFVLCLCILCCWSCLVNCGCYNFWYERGQK